MNASKTGFAILKHRNVRWRNPENASLEHLTLEMHDNRITATSVVITGSAGVWYQAFLDDDWRIKALSIHTTGTEWFVARSPQPGSWCDGDGRELAAFTGCRDVLLPGTPFDLTPMIRRLDLGDGAQRDLNLLQVNLDVLQPVRVSRTLNCLRRGEQYRLDNPLTGNPCEFRVDADGLAMETSSGFRQEV